MRQQEDTTFLRKFAIKERRKTWGRLNCKEKRDQKRFGFGGMLLGYVVFL